LNQSPSLWIGTVFVTHGTVFVLTGAQVGRTETEIVSSGVEIVIDVQTRGGFCAAKIEEKAGWFLC